MSRDSQRDRRSSQRSSETGFIRWNSFDESMMVPAPDDLDDSVVARLSRDEFTELGSEHSGYVNGVTVARFITGGASYEYVEVSDRTDTRIAVSEDCPDRTCRVFRRKVDVFAALCGFADHLVVLLAVLAAVTTAVSVVSGSFWITAAVFAVGLCGCTGRAMYLCLVGKSGDDAVSQTSRGMTAWVTHSGYVVVDKEYFDAALREVARLTGPGFGVDDQVVSAAAVARLERVVAPVM